MGYFLFIAQYLQLVAGLSPFQAGLVSLPVREQRHNYLVSRIMSKAEHGSSPDKN